MGHVAEILGFEPRRSDSKSDMLPLHHISSLFSYKQMRQELNLRPAVLETAALPAELRT